MSKAVAIGYKDDILPLGVWGMKLVPIASPDELIAKLNKIFEDIDVALIVVSEAAVKDSPATLSALRVYLESPPRVGVPILLLPTHRGSYGTSLRETAGILRAAIGVDILEGG
jgi:vacuolar-type H+-ATPase subunit F/Vma7